MPGPRPTIRRARLADGQTLAALMRASVHALCRRNYSEDQITAVAAAFGFGTLDEQLIRDQTYFVAELGGTLVGCGGWSRRSKTYAVRHDGTGDLRMLPHPAPGRAAIRAIFVHPDTAGRGVGQLLVRAAEANARKLGYEEFEIVATLTGVPLYRKLAYRMHGVYSFDLPGGYNFPFALMSKSDRQAVAAHTSGTCGGAPLQALSHAGMGLA